MEQAAWQSQTDWETGVLQGAQKITMVQTQKERMEERKNAES